MSESQPGRVNTLWVEQKCYRADETHSIQYEFPLYIFLGMFVMQSVMLIAVHTGGICCLCFVLCREWWVGWGVFHPPALEDTRAFFILQPSCISLVCSSMPG